ncbi:MAG TPA: hypothetical protein V6D33_03470 [Cyanophyceae cyanobacterium]
MACRVEVNYQGIYYSALHVPLPLTVVSRDDNRDFMFREASHPLGANWSLYNPVPQAKGKSSRNREIPPFALLPLVF